MNAAGNSSERLDYATVDSKPLQGISYYRLKQTNVDGCVSDSLTDDVNYLLKDFKFAVLPNPTTSKNLILNMKGVMDSKIIVSLIDVSGKQLFSAVVVPESNNFFYKINLNDKPAAGYYLAEIKLNGKIFSKPVVLQ